jgi:hypothetical protein
MREPTPGWYREPDWSRTFPQYETTNREEGIRRYWDEYYATAEGLASQYPDNFRVFDMHSSLNTPEEQRDLLTFAGFPREEQILNLEMRTNTVETAQPRRRDKPSENPADPRRCVVLVPYTGHIVQQCDDALKELERRGYTVRRVGGYAAIDQGRNQLATDALLDGFEETMWIDSDVSFHPNAVDRLRSHQLPVVCGIYPQKGKRALACHILPGTPRLVFGERGGLTEILYAGAGFLLIRREVYHAVQEQLSLPMCNERFGRPMIPFFLPMMKRIEDGHWYLAEDYAFCQRVRDCGYKIMADTSFRLWHYGSYGYSWEDSGMDRERHGSFTLNFPNMLRPEDSPQNPPRIN